MTEAINTQMNSYQKLSKTLNKIPNGFATLKDGTHLRVLEWIFTPEEADLASKMKLVGETVEKMSKRLKIPVDQLQEMLDIMHKKGQIRIDHKEKGNKYGLYPFVVGIYEEQLHRMDAEFAQLFEDYVVKSRGEILFTEGPPIHRIVPINSVIKTELLIHPYNEAEKVVRNAKSWAIRDCICRKQQELIGNDCKYPMSVCLSFSSRENAYKDKSHVKTVTLNEAIKLLKEAEEAGLVHSSMNIASGQRYICNCCSCCCGVFKGLTTYDQPNAFAKSDYMLSIDDSCIGCGKCLERCQFNALEIIDKKCIVSDRCVGCGVCAIVCPKESMSLIPRKAKDTKKPPKNIMMWMVKRFLNRLFKRDKVI